MLDLFTPETVAVINTTFLHAWKRGYAEAFNHDLLFGIFYPQKKRGTKIKKNAFIEMIKTKSKLTEWKLKNLVSRKIFFGRRRQLKDVSLSLETCQTFLFAYTFAYEQFGVDLIEPEHLFIAIIDNSNSGTKAYKIVQQILAKTDISFSRLSEQIITLVKRQNLKRLIDQDRLGTFSKNNRYYSPRRTRLHLAILSLFTKNLSRMVSLGKIDPVFGRENEIERIISILLRFRKNNPLLLGEPGVGKTAVIEALAIALKDSRLPKKFSSMRILELNLAGMLAGSKHRGEFEEKFQLLMLALNQFTNSLLVIDEIHTVVGAGTVEGTGTDASGLLKPVLQNGLLKCLGATTKSEYDKIFKKDLALERLFQIVMVPEPTHEIAVKILEGLRFEYEKHHYLKIEQSALEEAVKLSSIFIKDRFLPDKAFDLIDEGCSRVKILFKPLSSIKETYRKIYQGIMLKKRWAIEKQDFSTAYIYRAEELGIRGFLIALLDKSANDISREKKILNLSDLEQTLGSEMICDVVTSWTGIPMVKSKISQSEAETLNNLETNLQSRVIGQITAVEAIVKAIKRARIGLKNPNRPIASFIFAGPTGVGKTELAKALAFYFFDSEESLVRLDMSEYMDKHNLSKLIGSPPGYTGYDEGGFLTEKIKNKPYCVVLFDEMEKAHPDIFNLLLQILEDGRLTDSQNRLIDFKNTFIILTSNVGSQAIQDETKIFQLTKGSAEVHYKKLEQLVNIALKAQFRPEFLNRLDQIIVFQQLTLDEVQKIAKILLNNLAKRVFDKLKYTLIVEKSAENKLALDGYDPLYGARPLRRTIMNLVENKLSNLFLKSTYPAGTIFKVFLDNRENIGIRFFLASDVQLVENSAENLAKITAINKEMFMNRQKYLKHVGEFSISQKFSSYSSNFPKNSNFPRFYINSKQDILRIKKALDDKLINYTDCTFLKTGTLSVDQLLEYAEKRKKKELKNNFDKKNLI